MFKRSRRVFCPCLLGFILSWNGLCAHAPPVQPCLIAEAVDLLRSQDADEGSRFSSFERQGRDARMRLLLGDR